MTEQMCLRCGILFEQNPSRKALETCPSCRARKVQVLDGCIPWHGMFGADMVTPIRDDGSPVAPGIRTCGNTDCVSGAHVIKIENK